MWTADAAALTCSGRGRLERQRASLQAEPQSAGGNKMLRISQIKLNMNEPVSLLPKKIGQKLRVRNFHPDSWSIVKESVDAREKAAYPALFIPWILQ